MARIDTIYRETTTPAQAKATQADLTALTQNWKSQPLRFEHWGKIVTAPKFAKFEIQGEGKNRELIIYTQGPNGKVVKAGNSIPLKGPGTHVTVTLLKKVEVQPTAAAATAKPKVSPEELARPEATPPAPQASSTASSTAGTSQEPSSGNIEINSTTKIEDLEKTFKAHIGQGLNLTLTDNQGDAPRPISKLVEVKRDGKKCLVLKNIDASEVFIMLNRHTNVSYTAKAANEAEVARSMAAAEPRKSPETSKPWVLETTDHVSFFELYKLIDAESSRLKDKTVQLTARLANGGSQTTTFKYGKVEITHGAPSRFNIYDANEQLIMRTPELVHQNLTFTPLYENVVNEPIRLFIPPYQWGPYNREPLWTQESRAESYREALQRELELKGLIGQKIKTNFKPVNDSNKQVFLSNNGDRFDHEFTLREVAIDTTTGFVNLYDTNNVPQLRLSIPQQTAPHFDCAGTLTIEKASETSIASATDDAPMTLDISETREPIVEIGRFIQNGIAKFGSEAELCFTPPDDKAKKELEQLGFKELGEKHKIGPATSSKFEANVDGLRTAAVVVRNATAELITQIPFTHRGTLTIGKATEASQATNPTVQEKDEANTDTLSLDLNKANPRGGYDELINGFIENARKRFRTETVEVCFTPATNTLVNHWKGEGFEDLGSKHAMTLGEKSGIESLENSRPSNTKQPIDVVVLRDLQDQAITQFPLHCSGTLTISRKKEANDANTRTIEINGRAEFKDNDAVREQLYKACQDFGAKRNLVEISYSANRPAELAAWRAAGNPLPEGNIISRIGEGTCITGNDSDQIILRIQADEKSQPVSIPLDIKGKLTIKQLDQIRMNGDFSNDYKTKLDELLAKSKPDQKFQITYIPDDLAAFQKYNSISNIKLPKPGEPIISSIDRQNSHSRVVGDDAKNTLALALHANLNHLIMHIPMGCRGAIILTKV